MSETGSSKPIEFSHSRMFGEEIALTMGMWAVGSVAGLLLGGWPGTVVSLSFFFGGNYFGSRLPPRIHGVSKSQWDRAKELAEERKERQEAKREYCRRARELHETLAENEEHFDKEKTYTGGEWVIEVSKRD